MLEVYSFDCFVGAVAVVAIIRTLPDLLVAIADVIYTIRH